MFLGCRAARAAAGERADADLNDPGNAVRALEQARAALDAKPLRAAEARLALNEAAASEMDKGIAAEASFRLGVLDEDELKYPLALSDYARSSTEAPSSVWARNARKRIAWLKEHAEGDFVPLARFERARRSPAPSEVAPLIEALARDADNFPDGRTRSEARMLVAQTWLKTPERSRAAADELAKILADGSAEPKTKLFAERDLVGFWLARGAVDQAAEVLRTYPFDSQLVRKVHELSSARTMRRSLVVLSVLLGVVVVGLAGRRRGVALRPTRAKT